MAIQEAEKLFDLSLQSQIAKSLPSCELLPVYNAMLNVYASYGLGSQAKDLLIKMNEKDRDNSRRLIPNVKSYTSAINAWARSSDVNAANLAKSLLYRMDYIYQSGEANLKPDVMCYRSVINTFSRKGDVKSIMNLLHLMQCESANITLDTKCYTSIIHAFSKSNDMNSASYARKLLDEMNLFQIEGLEGVSPNTFSYTAVINACTSAQDVKSKKVALQIAR